MANSSNKQQSFGAGLSRAFFGIIRWLTSGSDVPATLWTLLPLIGGGVWITIAYAGSFQAASLPLMVALGCFVAGAAVGFLFGIPRTDDEQETPSNDARGGRYPSKPNTSLEQICDWLTKILIGAGLVQIHPLLQSLHGRAEDLASELPESKQSVSFALFLITLFGTLGFLSGYLMTRLFLAGAMTRADSVFLAGLQKQAEEVAEESAEIRHLTSWVKAFTTAALSLRKEAPPGDREWAIELLLDQGERVSEDRAGSILLGRLYRMQHQLDKAIGVLNSYLVRETSAGRTTTRNFADVLYNRACYEALQWEADQEKPLPKMKALEDLKQSIAVWEPNIVDAMTDDDFAELRTALGGPEKFRDAVLPPKTPPVEEEP